MHRRAAAVLVLSCAVALVWGGGPARARDVASDIDAHLTRYHDAGLFNGAALVASGRKVVFKKGYGYADFEWRIPNTPDTKFRLGSITKQFTATLILQLIGEGKLSLETKLSDALPYYRKDTGARITIHQLLNHTSGIPSYTGRPDFMRDVARDPYGVREFVEKFCSGDLEFEPGSRYAYNNSGYFLLGAIVEHLTGKSYEKVLAERVLVPLGMRATGYDRSAPILEKRARGYSRGPAGVTNADYLDMSLPYAAGSLYSTVEDLFIWDQALYGDAVLPAATKATMFTPGLQNYGYGWTITRPRIGVDHVERLAIGHGGGINGFNTLIQRIPDDGHLVVLLNNTGGTNLNAMFQGVADILYGRTPPAPRRPIAPVLYQTIADRGIDAAVENYRTVQATRAAEFDLTAPQLDGLGRALVAEGRSAEAIRIFTLNVETYPKEARAYLGLAEGHAAAGDTASAVKALAKALEIDPGNRAAVERLNQLVRRYGPKGRGAGPLTSEGRAFTSEGRAFRPGQID